MTQVTQVIPGSGEIMLKVYERDVEIHEEVIHFNGQYEQRFINGHYDATVIYQIVGYVATIDSDTNTTDFDTLVISDGRPTRLRDIERHLSEYGHRVSVGSTLEPVEETFVLPPHLEVTRPPGGEV
ncbi:hypothetical protein QM806_14265 [Rhodococcus sp. IEGM 1351]|uniref:hypothetical protein n=1 Tax=Rhodococcus sp. IEGM 1351 TaxID=3047089 RepID=UPI0024B79CD7|nr:hypothetical protein [Rhodococcus sp. IEGM 1351]MDI9936583.1 hypothetical protein [Rhodococcus sp. IEGM 1351]